MARIIRTALDRTKSLPPILWISALLIGFWIFASRMEFFLLHEIVSAIYIGVALAVVVVFGWTSAVALITVGGIDRAQQVALGISLSWLGNEFHRIYHLWWRVIGEPLDVINRDIVTFFLWVTVIGGVLHITVPTVETGLVPRTSWLVLGAAIAVGAAVAGFIVGANLIPGDQSGGFG